MKNTIITFLITSIIMIFSNCSNSNTKLESREYASKEERVEILKKVIVSKSKFIDAEFELF